MNEYLKRDTHIGAFIPVPASILTSELSSTTILIYGAILSRSILSQKNGCRTTTSRSKSLKRMIVVISYRKFPPCGTKAASNLSFHGSCPALRNLEQPAISRSKP